MGSRSVRLCSRQTASLDRVRRGLSDGGAMPCIEKEDKADHVSKEIGLYALKQFLSGTLGRELHQTRAERPRRCIRRTARATEQSIV